MEFSSIYIDRGLDFSFFKRHKRVFLIHGHDLDNLERLRTMLYDLDFRPITMGYFQAFSSYTVIEKFEKLSMKCKFAIALCTPDDKVENKKDNFFQPRPNVIYEIGWFCAKYGRKNVMLIVKDGTEIFSDFQGIVQIKFKEDVKDIYRNLHLAFRNRRLL